MKKSFFLLLLSLNVISSKSQVANTWLPKDLKYSVSAQVSTPIYLTGSDKYNNDNWVLGGDERTYYKFGIGLDGKYYFNQNIALRVWAGWSERKLYEHSYYEVQDFGNTISQEEIFNYR